MSQRGSSSSRSSKRGRSVREVGESSSQRRGMSTPELREGWSPQPVDFLDILNVYEDWPNLCQKDHPVHLIKSMFDASKEGAFHFSGGSLVLHDFYQRVSRINPAMKGVIDRSNFQHLCLLKNRRNDQRVVYALMERWWPSTHTFHLPNVELGFTPLDFIALTGIPVGLSPPPPYVVDKVDSSVGINNIEELISVRLERLENVFPGAERSWADTNCVGIRCRQLGLFLNPAHVPTNPQINRDLSEEEETLIRAFFLLFIGHELLPNNKSAVSFGWLPAVEDIYRFGCYDWGGVAMARMYRYLDRCATGKTHTADFCWKVLQYWYYEYFGTPAPTLINHEIDIYPRALRWSTERTTRQIGDTDHNTSLCRRRLEESTTASVNWHPWLVSPLTVMRPDVDQVAAYSRRRVALYGGSEIVWYLGERCWRQLTGRTAIPAPPPDDMLISDGAYEMWRENGTVPYDVDYLLAECDEATYSRYWRGASLGPVAPVRYRTGNREEVNPGRSTDPTIQPFQPALPMHWSGALPTQQVPGSLSEYFADLSIQVRDGYVERVDPAPVGPWPPVATPSAWRELAVNHGEAYAGSRERIAQLATSRETVDRRCERGVRRLARSERLLHYYAERFGFDPTDAPGVPDTVSDDSPEMRLLDEDDDDNDDDESE